MAWRLHLSNRPVLAVQLIPGSPPQVVAWDQRRRVHFYDQRSGTPLEVSDFTGSADSTPPPDLADSDWRAFLAGLRAPNGSALPTVYLSGLTIFNSRDGRMHLYHFQDGRLLLDIEGQHVALAGEGDGLFVAAGLGRALGLIGAVDEQGALHVFQQHVPVGVYDLGFATSETRPTLLLPDASNLLIVSDGGRVRVVDAAGRVKHTLEVYFSVGAVAVSPDGQTIALADTDANVIRLYDGTLRPTRQKHAEDLLAGARQVQLLASLPGRHAALTALDVADDGALAFAIGGVVCLTEVTALDALPQPRPLF